MSEKKIVIKFDPAYSTSGLTSQIRWSDPETKKIFEMLFHMRKNEKLTGIEIEEDCITARFEYVKEGE